MNKLKTISLLSVLLVVSALCFYTGLIIVTKSADLAWTFWPTAKRLLTTTLFWTLMFLIARLFWHAGSACKRKGAK